MPYVKESTKWHAYQFCDPFAAGSFIVCNKITKIFCQPDCDQHPITNLKSEIKFTSTPMEARNMGYEACQYCNPDNLPSTDVELLIKVVGIINSSIGFVAPLICENEEDNNSQIIQNIHKDTELPTKRRSSVPLINDDGSVKSFDSALSKNDSDHYKLVDLACRHLALAAANNVFGKEEDPTSPSDSKRRRRGGVLGFKELAAKSKLSAWHFHRVFKSVTNLTPKAYGDKCWDYLKSYQENIASGGDGSNLALPAPAPAPKAPVSRKRSVAAGGASKKRKQSKAVAPEAELLNIQQVSEGTHNLSAVRPEYAFPSRMPSTMNISEAYQPLFMENGIATPSSSEQFDLNLNCLPMTTPVAAFDSFTQSPMDDLFEASEFFNEQMFYTTSAAGFSAHTRSESAPELALNFSLFDPSSAMMSLDPVAETANYEALYSDTALDNVSLHETLAHMPQTAHMHPELTRLNTELRVVSNYNMP